MTVLLDPQLTLSRRFQPYPIIQMGGNIPFQQFISSYEPAELGGYAPGMSISEKYNCWAASQYKEKVRISNNMLESPI